MVNNSSCIDVPLVFIEPSSIVRGILLITLSTNKFEKSINPKISIKAPNFQLTLVINVLNIDIKSESVLEDRIDFVVIYNFYIVYTMIFIILISIVIVLLLIVFLQDIVKTEAFQRGTEFIESDVDRVRYAVIEPYISAGSKNKYGVSSKREAANTLARINIFIFDLIDHLRAKYITSSILQPNNAAIDITERISQRYVGPAVISEHIPDNLDETAYTLNKQYIRFCLRDPLMDNSIHSLSLLQFVALHELAHMGIDIHDHEKEFWEAFKFLLVESVEAGLYVPEDYSNSSKSYCGLRLTYNPYFDVTL